MVDGDVGGVDVAGGYGAELVFNGVFEVVGGDLELGNVLDHQREGGSLAVVAGCGCTSAGWCIKTPDVDDEEDQQHGYFAKADLHYK